MRHVPLNAFESKLKRQLTGGVVGAEIARAEAAEKNALPEKYMEHKKMMAARRKELQEQAEDEEDSRTRNIVGSGSGALEPTTGKSTEVSTGASGASAVAGSMGGLKKKNKEAKYKAAVHPAALKVVSTAVSSESAESAPSTSSMTPTKQLKASGSGSGGKKRHADFFSSYMDERAGKLAKKKNKHGKVDPDDD